MMVNVGNKSSDSVAFEVLVRGTSALSSHNVKLAAAAGHPTFVPGTTLPVNPGVKLFLCMSCAEKVLMEALEKVQRVKALGPEAYQFMEAL